MVREIELFVASPGDLVDERRLVARVADQVVQMCGVNLGLRVRVTGWEQVAPELGRPQELINPLVDSCDIFLGLISRRWGTQTGTHSSGFLEEFERAVARRNGSESSPAIAVYFKKVSEADAEDAGPQLSQVLAFRRRVHQERLALTGEFETPEDLERQLTAYLVGRLAREGAQTPAPEAPDQSVPGETGVSSPEDSGEGAPGAAQEQLQATLTPFQRVLSGQEPDGLLDADRLLLFALSLDESAVVPTHVANRLFTRRADLELVRAEAVHWLRTIAADFQSDDPAEMVIPGWGLVHGSASPDVLAEMIGHDDARAARGAIRLLRYLRLRQCDYWPNSPDAIESASARWTTLLQDTWRSREAFSWLASGAQAADGPLLETIRNALGDEDGARVHALALAVEGDLSAAASLAAEDTYGLGDWLHPILISNVEAISSEDLQRLAALERPRNDRLREAAFDKLRANQTLTPADYVAALLSNDGRDADEVLSALRDDPQVVDLAPTIISLLEERKGLDAMEAATRVMAINSEDADPSAVSALALAEWDALMWRGHPAMVEAARSFLRAGLAGYRESAQEHNDYFDETPRMAEFIYGHRARVAAAVLSQAPATQRDPGDAQLVRMELRRADRLDRGHLALALARYGDPSDVDLLLEVASDAALDRRDEMVGAALRLGETSAARELASREDEAMAEAGVRALARDEAVSHEEIEPFLRHKGQRVRMAAIRGLLDRLNEEQLHILLDRYPREGGSYYYNVVSAIDRKLSAPRELATRALEAAGY